MCCVLQAGGVLLHVPSSAGTLFIVLQYYYIITLYYYYPKMPTYDIPTYIPNIYTRLYLPIPIYICPIYVLYIYVLCP